MIPTGRRTESFADDLNTRRGIVSGRVALLPRSTEIQPFVAPIRPSPLRHTSPKSNFLDVRPEVRSERPPEAARLGFPLRCPGETCSFPPNASSHCMPSPRTRGKRRGTSAGFAASTPLLLPRRTKSARERRCGSWGTSAGGILPGPWQRPRGALRAGFPLRYPGDSLLQIQHLPTSSYIILSLRTKGGAGKVLALRDPGGGELARALAAMRAGSPPRGPGDSIPPIQHLHPSSGIILSPRAKDSAGKVLASGGLCGGDFARALAAEAPGRPCCARPAGQILPGPWLRAAEGGGRGMRRRPAEARPCGRRARRAPRRARACGRGLPRRALPRPRGMLAPAAKGGFSRPGPAARGRGAPCGHARLPRPRGMLAPAAKGGF